MQDDNRETKTKVVCILNGCGKPTTKKFTIEENLTINVCDNCFDRILRQQNDKVKNKLCKHKWHANKDTMKNFCVHCEIQQPELENGENKNAR